MKILGSSHTLTTLVYLKPGITNVIILIASNHPDIVGNQLDKREGGIGQPHAEKTPLQWTVFGCLGEVADQHVHIN